MVEVFTVLTDSGKRLISEGLIGYNYETEEPFDMYHVRWFRVGSGGYQGGNVITPDPRRTNLVNPTTELSEINIARINEFNCPTWTIILGVGIGGDMSEVGLFGRRIKTFDASTGNVTYYNNEDPVLYCYGTFGQFSKDVSETDTIEVSVQF